LRCREIPAARPDGDIRAEHLDGDRAIGTVETLQRAVSQDVIRAGLPGDVVERRSKVVVVADALTSGLERQGRQHVGVEIAP
jgi:hypothetical protein